MKHEALASTRGHSHILKFHTDVWSDSNCTLDNNLALQFFFVCKCVRALSQFPSCLLIPFKYLNHRSPSTGGVSSLHPPPLGMELKTELWA